MNFGILSNGFRPHTTAAQTYDEDLFEIVLADQLGFRDAWISEHHGQPVYLNNVDVLPIPELLICKAAGLTKQIRMGPAVKILHLYNPVDVALQVAVTDHLTNGRYMFGFGSGFGVPVFSEERGLSFEDRHERMAESLELIQKCWTSEEPFDWNGKFWQGKGITIIPKPLQGAAMPMATATFTPSTVDMAGRLGYILLSLGAPDSVRATGERYARAGIAAGYEDPLDRFTVARFIYIADSMEQAADDIRPAVELEMGYQRARGLFATAIASYGLQKDVDEITFDDLAAAGVYLIGDPETVYQRIYDFYQQSGGFGTLLYIVGKEWATRDKRANSMRRFMQEVAPRLRGLSTAPKLPQRATT